MSLGFWLCALSGCVGTNADDSAGGACGRSPPLDWDNFGQGFMNKHCVGCHSSLLPEGLREGAPLNVNLDAYVDVMTQAERIRVRSVGDAPTMPPGGGPSQDERALLDEWLACQVASDAEIYLGSAP